MLCKALVLLFSLLCGARASPTCEKRVTRVTTGNRCSFWTCFRDHPPRYRHFTLPVSPDTCRRWTETKFCPQCSGSEQDCKLTPRPRGLFQTNAQIQIKWKKVAFGTARWTGDSIDCRLSEEQTPPAPTVPVPTPPQNAPSC